MNSGSHGLRLRRAARCSRRWAWARCSGWFAGSVWLGVSGALGLYLAWNLWQLRALHFWLQHRSVADPPDAMGLWGDVVAQVVRLHRRKRFHKERLTRLFRELRRSTAAMPDGVVMLDPQGEIVWFNRKAGELLDLSRRADLGLRIDNLVRNPDFVRYLHGGQYSMPVIVRIDTPTERHIAFQLISYGEDQRLLMLRDVTREVRMEQMRKDFVANASHELRSPLTVVAGYLENFGADPGLGELAAPDRRDAPPDRSHDAHHRGPARAVALRSQRRADQGHCPSTSRDGGAAAQGRAGARPCIRARSRSSIESGGQPHRRRSHGAVGVFEPGRQRRQVHARRRQHADPLVDGRGGRAFLGARHRARHLQPSTFRGSRNASTASIRAARAKPAARGWAWPSSNTRCIATAAASRSRASKAGAARSPVISRASACSKRRVAASA